MYKLFKVSHFPVKNGEMARYCIGRADDRFHPRLDSAINQEVGARLGRSHKKKTRELWRVYTRVCFNWPSFFLGKPVFSDPDTLKRAFKAWPASHSVKLKCNAKGTPPLKYIWLKDGELLKGRRPDQYLNTSIWYLKLKDLVPKDAGQYTCIVSNRYGSINHTYTVRVLGKNTAAYLRFHCRLVVF